MAELFRMHISEVVHMYLSVRELAMLLGEKEWKSWNRKIEVCVKKTPVEIWIQVTDASDIGWDKTQINTSPKELAYIVYPVPFCQIFLAILVKNFRQLFSCYTIWDAGSLICKAYSVVLSWFL